jgi:hypothetical protein
MQPGRDVYLHRSRMAHILKRDTTLVGDGEVGGAGEEGGSVGQGSAALAVAHGELHLVKTRLKRLVLRWLSLKVELDAVPAQSVTKTQRGKDATYWPGAKPVSISPSPKGWLWGGMIPISSSPVPVWLNTVNRTSISKVVPWGPEGGVTLILSS